MTIINKKKIIVIISFFIKLGNYYSCHLLKLYIFAFRQYYSFITDTSCKRLGTQCWVYGAIMLCETLLCVKNGKELFGHTKTVNIIVWFIFMFFATMLCISGCVLWHKYFEVKIRIIFTQKFIFSRLVMTMQQRLF